MSVTDFQPSHSIIILPLHDKLIHVSLLCVISYLLIQLRSPCGVVCFVEEEYDLCFLVCVVIGGKVEEVVAISEVDLLCLAVFGTHHLFHARSIAPHTANQLECTEYGNKLIAIASITMASTL